MKISFIDWFVSLFFRDMKNFGYDETVKEKMYEKITRGKKQKKKCEKKI